MLRDVLGRRTSQADDDIFMNAPGTLSEPHHEQDIQNDLNDDIFGSAPTSPTLNAQDAPSARASDHPSDIQRLRSTHVTNGYREGIAVSKEQYIQAGFDEGYSLGGEIGLKAGWCLGALEGMRRGLRQSSSGDERVLSLREEMLELHEEAQKDLKTEKLFSPQYFSPEGVSLFGVSLQEGQVEEDITFSDVAAAHPLVKKWTEKVSTLALSLGVKLDRQERN